MGMDVLCRKKERQFFSFLLAFFLSFVLSFSLFLSLTPSSPSPADWLPLECETRLIERREIERSSEDGLGWATIVLRSMMNEIYGGIFNEGHLIYTNNVQANVTFHFEKLGKENKWNV